MCGITISTHKRMSSTRISASSGARSISVSPHHFFTPFEVPDTSSRRMRRLLRSTAVRLAFGYAFLFIISALLLAVFLWWRTALYLDREIDAVIVADGRAISDRLRDFGLPGAIETISERVGHATDEHAIYLLVDPTLHPVAGNLEAWPLAVNSAPGWYRINLVRDDNFHATRVLFGILPGEFRLLVGRDVQDRVEILALIVNGLGWASLAAM